MVNTTFVRNDLADEVDALAVVGRALAGLDPIARDRVMRWAMERFGVSRPATQIAAAASCSRRAQPRASMKP
jgi:hypothetical protein